MTETLNAKTFDITAAYSGRTYPEIRVPVFLDEAAQWKLGQLVKESEQDPLNKEKLDAVSSHLELFQKLAITFVIQGRSREDREKIINSTLENHPPKTDAFGRNLPNPVADAEYENKLLSLHTKTIYGPDGSEVPAFSVEDAALFRNQAPDSALKAISEAIEELSTGSLSGYQTAIQDLDFLSKASPEV